MAQLGRKYKDKITGFEGVATGTVQYISGCNQVLLAPAAVDGAMKDSHWIDEQRLELLEGAAITLDNGKTPGCDLSAPVR